MIPIVESILASFIRKDLVEIMKNIIPAIEYIPIERKYYAFFDLISMFFIQISIGHDIGIPIK